MSKNPVIDPHAFEQSHGRAPRGEGYWLFELRANGQRVSQPNGLLAGAPVTGCWLDGLFAVNAAYGVAKRAAVSEARRIGAVVVVVMP